MGLLENLMGGVKQAGLQDFIQRYEQGAPWEGISHQEALSRYQEVAPQIPHEEYAASAEEAYARLTPEQRAQLGRLLQARAQQSNLRVPGMTDENTSGQLQDPGTLARLTSRMRQEQPGIISQLLDGSGEGVNPLAKAALAGIAAIAIKRMMAARGTAP